MQLAHPLLSVRCISREVGTVQYPAIEYHFLGVDRLRGILPEEQQIGTFPDLHGADVPIQLDRALVSVAD